MKLWTMGSAIVVTLALEVMMLAGMAQQSQAGSKAHPNKETSFSVPHHRSHTALMAMLCGE